MSYASTFFHSDPVRQCVWISGEGPTGRFEHHESANTPDWTCAFLRVPTFVEPRMDRVRARLANEHVVVQEWDDVRNPDIALTPGVLRQLADRIGCSISEAMDVSMWHDARGREVFSASEQLHCSVERHANTIGTRDVPMHHKRRSLALAVAFGRDCAMSVPLSQILGYEGSTARRMEPSLPIDLPELPRSADVIDLESEVRAFVRHVDLAVRCALDSPQEITLDLASGFHLTFQNVRLSDSVRGLEVSMTTGGKLFYRDLSLVPGTTGVVFKNRQLPQRKIPYEIISQIARDIFIAETYYSEVLRKRDLPPAWLLTAREYVDRLKQSKA